MSYFCILHWIYDMEDIRRDMSCHDWLNWTVKTKRIIPIHLYLYIKHFLNRDFFNYYSNKQTINICNSGVLTLPFFFFFFFLQFLKKLGGELPSDTPLIHTMGKTQIRQRDLTQNRAKQKWIKEELWAGMHSADGKWLLYKHKLKVTLQPATRELWTNMLRPITRWETQHAHQSQARTLLRRPSLVTGARADKFGLSFWGPEIPACLHTTAWKGKEGGGAHKARNRELKKKEGLKKDLSPKVEQQKQKSVLERDRKVHLNSWSS